MEDYARPDSFTTPCRGLFELKTRKSLASILDHEAGYLAVGAVSFPDDLLTSLAIAPFGQEAFARLTIARPARIGVAALLRNQRHVCGLLREYPVRPQMLEVGIDPEAYPAWSRYVQQRTLHLQALATSIRPASGTLEEGLGVRRPAFMESTVGRPHAAETVRHLSHLVITVNVVVSEIPLPLKGALA